MEIHWSVYVRFQNEDRTTPPPSGYGSTPQEALDNLREQLDDMEQRTAARLFETREAIDSVRL
jgi:hypothetical protein